MAEKFYKPRTIKGKPTKFEKLLLEYNISPYMLQHATKITAWATGIDAYRIDKGIVYSVVRHKKDFNKSTVDKLLFTLSAMTGHEFTYNDILEPFRFI